LPDRLAVPTLPGKTEAKQGSEDVTKAFSRRRVLTGAAAVSAAAVLPRASLGAGDWRPTETVRLIVPAAAGARRVMGRLLAAHLQTVQSIRTWRTGPRRGTTAHPRLAAKATGTPS
jgi:hypothetical protein